MRKVFISYSRIDKDLVLVVKAELEKIPGVECWMDVNNIESGNPAFDEAIVKGIEECRVFLFMLSFNSQKSKWAINEMNLALKISEDTNGKVRPVMVNIDDCKLSNKFYLRYNRMDIIEWNNLDQRAKLLRDISRWVNTDQNLEIVSDTRIKPLERIESSAEENVEDVMLEAKEFEAVENLKGSFKSYLRAANLGDAKAQVKVAYMLYLGKGVTKDYDEAVRWCRLAVEQNYSSAQYLLGRMYFLGTGVEKDYQKALDLFHMAANQGSSKAQEKLGDIYLKGRPEIVSQDYVRAFDWYKKAAERGNATAQYKFGEMYFHGHGVEQDYIEALFWFRKSAEKNCPDALISLGYMYINALGVNKNIAESARNYGVAMQILQDRANHGDQRALKRLARLKDKMKDADSLD